MCAVKIVVVFGVWLNVANIQTMQDRKMDINWCSVYMQNGKALTFAKRTCHDVAAEINRQLGK